MNNQIKPVIKELQRNPFASLLEISQNLKTSYDKVSYAIKNSTLFLGNTLLISEQEIQRSIIFFKIKNKQALDSYCKFDKNIVEINYLIGNYDSYIIVESLENIKQLAKKIIFDLKEAITSYTILDANQFYKYGWYGL
ncbi:MAG: hypothetical protein KKF89_04575 [Nanoarchaeota archaeon]|nr:hypothetical protein [Nanoarchaeota archaeon]MBU1854969.1 hypothetical protein [Nanoarchaeota archaeon]